MLILKNSALVFLLLSACSCCKRNIASTGNTAVADTSATDPKLKEAVVIEYREVDGCRYLLELANKEKLQPENLPAEFEKENLKVLIKYHITNKMTVCMAGKTVYIDYIKMKKE